jgi:hypothetical protein
VHWLTTWAVFFYVAGASKEVFPTLFANKERTSAEVDTSLHWFKNSSGKNGAYRLDLIFRDEVYYPVCKGGTSVWTMHRPSVFYRFMANSRSSDRAFAASSNMQSSQCGLIRAVAPNPHSFYQEAAVKAGELSAHDMELYSKIFDF